MIQRFVIALCACILIGCGSAGLPTVIGPVLSVNELTSIDIGQFYAASGLEDEYAPTGEFAVYLRDAATGQDMACSGQDDGMKMLGKTMTYYGGLDIPLHAVDGDKPAGSARLQVVFVEKDGDDCPHPIASGDDIIGISPQLSSEDLLDKTIWATNGMAAVQFHIRGTEPQTPAPMAFSLQDGLIVDQVGLYNGNDGDQEHSYYIFAERYVGDAVVEVCQTSEEDVANIRYGNMIYAALNLPVPCIVASDPDFIDTQVKLSVWIQTDDGPQLVGETEIGTVGDIIGEQIDFTNDKGFIRLRNVAVTPFSARYARLEELQDLTMTSLEYVAEPAATESVEVHLISPDGYSIICTATDQGPDLTAAMLVVEGQRELFGYDQLNLVALGRADGKSCPEPLSGDYTVLGHVDDLEPIDFESGQATFIEGGSITWSYGAN